MAYQKFSAEKIFDGYRFLDKKLVLIIDSQGHVIDLISPEQAGEDVREMKGILSPGFINCHCHLELSHMRNKIPEGSGLVDFVTAVVNERFAPDEIILEAIADAENEMYRNGIVAVGDICNNTITLTQKSKGRLYYHNFIEASGYHPSVAEQRFERSLEIFKAYGENYSIPVEANSIVPHAPYSVSDALWEKIINFPGNHLFSLHNQESAEENEWFVNKTGNLHEMYKNMKINTDFFEAPGKTSLQCCLPKFLRNQQLILVHNVHTDYKDLQFAKAYKQTNPLFWCFCPNANQYISRLLPPIQLFIDHGCDIVLGTDSLASNYQLSILEEMRTLKTHFNSLKMEQLLSWATINGARALQCDSFLGSFEKGKMPGVVRLDEDLSAIERVV